MKKGNCFVITNVLNAKISVKLFLQEMQGWPLQTDEEIERRQKYDGRRYLPIMQRIFTDFLDLLIGKPVEIVEHK